MAHCFFKNYLCCAHLLLLSNFLIPLCSGFLPFGSFRLIPIRDTTEEATPPADIVVMPQETEDEKVGSLTQALPAGKHLSKKAKGSHVCEPLDREKYVEPVHWKIHILKTESNRAAKLGQTRHMDKDDVAAQLESAQANPPRHLVEATVSMKEGSDIPSVVCHQTLLYRFAIAGDSSCNFIGGTSFG